MVRTTVEVPATLGCRCHLGTEQVIWRWLAVDLGYAQGEGWHGLKVTMQVASQTLICDQH